MHIHDFSLYVIYTLILICTIILCAICGMKIYKLAYGTFGKENAFLKHRISSNSSPFGTKLDPRVIQTRIKFLRKPYKKMKESHARNMPPIVEVNTPVDSDAGPMEEVEETSVEESNEQVTVCPGKGGGVTNYWKKDTVIIVQ